VIRTIRHLVICLPLVLGLAGQKGTGQDLPLIQGATIQSSVTASDSNFKYNYTVTNSPNSVGAIWEIKLDISQPAGGLVLSGQGLANEPGFAAISSSAILSQPQTVPMVPVGFGLPPNWMASQSTSGKAQWAAEDSQFSVYPGQSIAGFELTSPGLPGIRTFSVEPYLDADDLPIDPPSSPSDLQRYLNDLSALEAKVMVQGMTIAPTAPPANFKPIEFLQTIQSYKERSVQQGWIADTGVAISLEVKLNAAQRALQTGDNETAKNVLNALINEVQAQANKHLTPEAVALLQFNSQYLISRLP
jgi:hypothetical protein